MTLEVQRVSGPFENELGSLRSCLVEGDPQSEKRARRIKQRAVAISIVLQTLALVALVLFPLLSKGERISLKYATPIPPYAPIGAHHQAASNPTPHTTTLRRFFQPTNIPPTVVTRNQNTSTEREDPPGELIPGVVPGDGIPGGRIPVTSRPDPPPREDPPAVVRRAISEPAQMAQLIRRVEPSYPTLARQTQREGRVELHALISTEGRIESLEVISGDPLFIQSALAAVREWRYRPTILNGRPIEVDTHITVIYTLSR
ncbi:MAG TPA: energy transducer TonB [Candidatus Acidoferrum sp.]|nr:energy transducer TonB [Candidatus Acidoferrum sp.]